jgi:23S rRNA pseudouridine1911/1915/1917 synthase
LGLGETARKQTKNAGFLYRERAPADAAGETVLGYLARRYTHSTEREWRERVQAGEVRLEGRPARGDDRLTAGAWLEWSRPGWTEAEVPLAYAVLHLDPHLLAVAKPRGLPTVPAGGFLDHTLLHLVRRRFSEAAPLHRLGRGTSGLVLFARSDLARRTVTRAFREGEVDKTYRALITGSPAEDAFTVDAPIGPVPHPRLGTVHAASETGRPALSQVQVLERREDASLVEVRIPTGRPHQIRIHLAVAGHPLVGDPLYAAGGALQTDPGLPGDGGYHLHAHRLALAHPAGGRVEIECPPPPLLKEAGSRDASYQVHP